LLTGNFAKRKSAFPPPLSCVPGVMYPRPPPMLPLQKLLKRNGYHKPETEARTAPSWRWTRRKKQPVCRSAQNHRKPSGREATNWRSSRRSLRRRITSPDDATAYKAPVAIVQEDNPNLSEPYDPTLELSHYEFPARTVACGLSGPNPGNRTGKNWRPTRT